MKKLNLFAFVALICIFFTSCGKSESSSKEGGSVSKEALVGCWVNEEGDPAPMCFNEDGTVVALSPSTVTRTDENGNVISKEVSYSLSEGVTYKLDGNDLTVTVNGESGTIKIEELNGDVMKLSAGGETQTVKRITKDEFDKLVQSLLNK